jgi:hypothetical protein
MSTCKLQHQQLNKHENDTEKQDEMQDCSEDFFVNQDDEDDNLTTEIEQVVDCTLYERHQAHLVKQYDKVYKNLTMIIIAVLNC